MSEVGIAEFKAHLSQYVRRARSGETITITDRGQPVVRLSRLPNSQRSSPQLPTRKLSDLPPMPPLDLGGLDPIALLLEMRQRDR